MPCGSLCKLPIDKLFLIVDSPVRPFFCFLTQMSLEDRIRKLAEDILECQDDGQTAVLAEEFQEAIQERIVHLRKKLWQVPLGRLSDPSN